MVSPLTIMVLVAYFAILLVIGIVAMRRTKTLEDFYVGGRQISGWVTALSFFTTYFSAVIFIGGAGMGWVWGLPIVWKDVPSVIIGTALAFMIIGPPLRVMTEKLGALSVAEYIEKRYDSKLAGLTATVIIFTGMFFYTISLLIGMGVATEIIVGIPYLTALWICVIVTLIYTALGGYFGQAWTQAVQAIVMLLIAVIVAVVALNAVGGLGALSTKLEAINPSLARWPYLNFTALLPFMLSLGFLGWGNPALILRFFSIKGTRAFRWSVLIAVFFVAITSLCINLASPVARVLYPNLPKPDAAMPHLVKDLFPPGFDAFFLVGVLAASMSTLTALLIVMSQCIVRDIVPKIRTLPEKRAVMLSRVVMVVVALICATLATSPPPMLVTIFAVTTALLAGVLVGPVVYGLYWRRVTAPSCACAMMAGFIAVIAVCAYGGFQFPWTYYAWIPAIILSLALPPIISVFTKPPSEELLSKIFAKTK